MLSSAAAAHASGTLNTHLYPMMCTGTLSLGPLFEDNKDKDTVSSALLYRSVYGCSCGFDILAANVGLDQSNKIGRENSREFSLFKYVPYICFKTFASFNINRLIPVRERLTIEFSVDVILKVRSTFRHVYHQDGKTENLRPCVWSWSRLGQV